MLYLMFEAHVQAPCDVCVSSHCQEKQWISKNLAYATFQEGKPAVS